MTAPRRVDPRLAAGGGVLVLASAGLLAFLGNWEGDENRVYADALAGGLPTVCGGITKHTSPFPVVVGDFWSDERCAEVMGMVVSKGQLKLLDCVKYPQLTQNQFDALSSHEHNFGIGATCASRAVGLFNAGRPDEGCEAIAHKEDGKTPAWSYVTVGYDKAGKPIQKFVRGLYSRRLAERALCLKK